MELVNLATELNKIIKNQKRFYVRIDQPTLDFTDIKLEFSLIISTLLGELSIPIYKSNIADVISLLKDTIFFDESFIISWNIKPFFTYAYHMTKKILEFNGSLFDLKVLEAYLLISNKEPLNYLESVDRLKDIFKGDTVNLKKIYKNIYLELIKKVLPKMEALPLGDKDSKKFLYSYYEIEGQINGRLNCFKLSDNFYNPQLMDSKIREKIKPINISEKSIICLDYKFFEVKILGWLCGDPVIEDLSKGDFYKNFYNSLFLKNCDTENKRDLAKKIFLPIVYGQCHNGLASSLNTSVDLAKKIIFKTKKIFSKTFDWMDNYKIDEDICYDYFGRKRIFEKEIKYKYRNFIIQSPASLFSLDKLVNLSNNISTIGYVICNIHDGYIVLSNKKDVDECEILCKRILENESIFFPNLKIMVESKISGNL